MLWLLLGIFAAVNATPCALRQSNDSYICVCNETYCDTIEPISDFSSELLYLYTTSKDGLRFHQQIVPKTENNSLDLGTLIIIPQTTISYQTIVGFGGAFTDSTVDNINSLPNALQDTLLMNYFSPSELGYTFGRVPIGCSDFSKQPYSYDESPGDYQLKYFSLFEEDIKGKIPMIKRAEDIAGRKLDLVAGMWGPPSWMKVDNKIISGGNVRVSAYKTFADYHIRFLDEYTKHGISFWGISNGNEPIDAYLSPQWLPNQMRLWLSRYFGPALNASYPNVRLLLLDDFPETMPDYLPILQDETVVKYVSGWAIHPYMAVDYIATNVAKARQWFPEKFVIQTEYSVGIHPEVSVVLGSWKRGENYAERIIEGFNNWCIGWIDWNLALNLRGGPTFMKNFIDAPVIVNGSEFYKQPTFYAQGHFSHFIKPGSRRIAVKSILTKGVTTTTTINPDGTVVVVLFNRDSTKYGISIRTGRYKQAVFEIPPNSISTAIYRPDD